MLARDWFRRRSERLFAGHRDPRREVCVVTRDRVTPLPHRRVGDDIAFDWGVRDAGAIELAYAVLRDVRRRPASDEVLFEFVADVIAGLPRDGFVLSADDVRHWLDRRGSRAEPRPPQAWISAQYWLFPFAWTGRSMRHR
jgi:hypothetical protein